MQEFRHSNPFLHKLILILLYSFDIRLQIKRLDEAIFLYKCVPCLDPGGLSAIFGRNLRDALFGTHHYQFFDADSFPAS